VGVRRIAGKLLVAGVFVALVPLAAACSGSGGSKTATPTREAATSAVRSPTAMGGTPAVTALASATVEGAGAPTETSSTSAGPLCTPAGVSADVHEQGGAGSLGGNLEIKNTSAAACVLRPLDGQVVPELRIKDAAGTLLPTQEQSQPGAIPDAAVTLQPGDSAFVTYVWSNWCGAAPNGALSVSYELPSGDEITATIAGTSGQDAVPRCDDSSQPSTLLVGNLIKRTP
jgi:hypothetical protein